MVDQLQLSECGKNEIAAITSEVMKTAIKAIQEGKITLEELKNPDTSPEVKAKLAAAFAADGTFEKISQAQQDACRGIPKEKIEARPGFEL